MSEGADTKAGEALEPAPAPSPAPPVALKVSEEVGAKAAEASKPAPAPCPAPSPPCIAAAPAASSGIVVGNVQLKHRFYWYDEPEMLMPEVRKRCPGFGFSDADVTFIDAAKRHPMRTTDISQAKFFLITIPTVSLWACKEAGNHTDIMNRALRKLVSSKAWTTSGGHRHVWMLFDWRLMRWADGQFKRIPDDPARGKWASHSDLMRHVTAMTYEDWKGHPQTCDKYSATFGHYCHPKDFNWMPFEYWKCTVVVPYFAGEGLSDNDAAKHFSTADFAMWMRREHHVFYRNDMKREYFWGATPIRRKPSALQGLPKVSVGGSVDKMEHLRLLRMSRFCIVTRGDTPSSHKLFDAIRELCIPVIISDLFFRVSKPFPTVVSWDHFTVSIPEWYFMKDPKQAVAFLFTFSEGELRHLYNSIVEARQVLDWRAPKSLATEAALISAVDQCMPGVTGF